MLKFFSSKSFWITFIIFVLLYSLNVMVNDISIGNVIQSFVAALFLALVSALIIGGIIYMIINAYKRKNKYN